MDALIVVDVQNDFCPGGTLAVPFGDSVIPLVNQYLAIAAEVGIPIFVSQDWHPQHTEHFADYGGRWSVHCVQGSPGATFHKDLRLPPSALVVRKGMSGHDDGYSAFEGRLETGRDLAQALGDHGVGRVYIGGLATDYCVLQTVLSARRAGFDTIWLRDASLPVEVNVGDGEKAEREMFAAGARACSIAQFNPARDSLPVRPLLSSQ
jgi:nicotinamidase/pyrazinamidase